MFEETNLVKGDWARYISILKGQEAVSEQGLLVGQ